MQLTSNFLINLTNYIRANKYCLSNTLYQFLNIYIVHLCMLHFCTSTFYHCRTFKIIDDDGSRSIDIKEFRKGIHDYGVIMEPETIQELFDSIDRDHSGAVDFDEFLRALRVSE